MFRRFSILISGLLFIAATDAGHTAAQETGKRPQKYALLIGIAKYSAGFEELPCCHADLEALKACLLQSGFPAPHIAYLQEKAAENLQPTKANIEAQLKLRMQLASPGDEVVVAFSGHGLQAEGKSYLCPLDARLDEPAESMIPLEEFESAIALSRATHKLLILDAWRSNPLRGAKALRGEAIAGSRPRGLRVLTSCEVGQFSVDDPKLHRGVFMHYLTQGWQGAADNEAEGNQDSKVSLDELFYYVHEKTKIHVANAFATLQLPALLGEGATRWELASLSSKPEIAKPVNAPAAAKPPAAQPNTASPKPAEPPPQKEIPPAIVKANTKSPSPPAPEIHPLLAKADALYTSADYDKAISTYSSIIANSDLSSAIRRAARLGRGSAYIAQGGKDNIQKALTDHKAAGNNAISLPVRKTSTLMLSSNPVGSVKENEVVQIGMINGDWLWVKSVNGNTSKQGYVKWEAVLAAPAAP